MVGFMTEKIVFPKIPSLLFKRKREREREENKKKHSFLMHQIYHKKQISIFLASSVGLFGDVLPLFCSLSISFSSDLSLPPSFFCLCLRGRQAYYPSIFKYICAKNSPLNILCLFFLVPRKLCYDFYFH